MSQNGIILETLQVLTSASRSRDFASAPKNAGELAERLRFAQRPTRAPVEPFLATKVFAYVYTYVQRTFMYYSTERSMPRIHKCFSYRAPSKDMTTLTNPSLTPSPGQPPKDPHNELLWALFFAPSNVQETGLTSEPLQGN